MSQENVDIVMEAFRRFEDFDIERAGELWHRDALLTGPEGWPEPGPFEGREAIMGQFQRLSSDWERNRISNETVILERGDWVAFTFRWETEGGKSGAATAVDTAGAIRIKDGKIAEGHFRWTPEAALEAAGLSE
jgi:ketosteroid isomerase-like protein